MKITKETRPRIYLILQQAYLQSARTRFVYQKGDKQKIQKMYVLLCDSMKLQDYETELEQSLDGFQEYVNLQTKKWSNWKSASRSNYLGFLLNRDNIASFGMKKTKTQTEEVTGFNSEELNDYL